MVNAQEWLEQNYPKNGTCIRETDDEFLTLENDEWKKDTGWNNKGKNRKEITKLNIGAEKLEGSLDLSDFANLEELLVSGNEITSLNLNGLGKLKKIDCDYNKLADLDLPNCLNLIRLNCNYNSFTSLSFLTTLNGEKLEEFSITNNISQRNDLTPLRRFTNLRELSLWNNNFYGSLVPLQNMNKLERLDIGDTDINKGVEHLPASIKKVEYSADENYHLKKKSGGKVKEIAWQLDLFNSRKQKYWKKLGFSLEEIKFWTKTGLTFNDYYLADYLRKQKNLSNLSVIRDKLPKLRKEYNAFSWRSSHPDFTPELQKEWEKRGFSYEECKEWISIIGLKVDDTDYVQWLRDVKKVDVEWILHNSDDLEIRKEYKMFLQKVERGSELSTEVINQIKEFSHSYGVTSFGFSELSWKQEELINELIPNTELRENYRNYGLCRKCSQPKTSHDWCRFCMSQKFAKEFSNWTSGNLEIDKFIQDSQLNATSHREILEWIPYNNFINVTHLADGGFGKMYIAKSIYVPIGGWDIEEIQWKAEVRTIIDFEEALTGVKTKTVALKILNGSQNMTTSFLQEITNHKLVSNNIQLQDETRSSLDKYIINLKVVHNIVNCYGISQDPASKNYVMVMDYIPGGSLREYLKNSRDFVFDDRFNKLCDIAKGLKSIHGKGLVHNDLHPGNILIKYDRYRRYREEGDIPITCYIIDLGLCRPANEKDSKIFGVLPYVAPEVLRGQTYTQKSDITFFKIIVHF